MKHTMIVADSMIEYAKELSIYINNKEGFPLTSYSISSMEEISEFVQNNKVDIFLVSKEMFKDVYEMTNSKHIIILDDNNGENVNEDIYRIDKYQSCDRIIKEILQYISKQDGMESLVTRRNSMNLLGFYSPVRRCYQTSLALTVGRLISKNCRSLYINLEGFSGLEHVLRLEWSGNLTDLMFAVNSGRSDISSLIGSIACQSGNLDIIPSMNSRRDLLSITFEEWEKFLYLLESNTDYEYVILDISESVSDLEEILNLCSKVYVTCTDEEMAKEKVQSFKDILSKEGYENVIDKLEVCNITTSAMVKMNIEELLRSTTGEYAKKIVRGYV